MEPALADDAAWWRCGLDGDGAAFGQLFDRHRDRVFRHAGRLVETRHDAEDVTAVAFLELWRRREAVHLVDGSVLPWLLVTTTNTARNLARGTRRHRAFLARLPRAAAAPDAADVALNYALAVDEPLRSALRSLPELDLQLFTLVALEDLSLTQAATVLDITPSAAKARLHRTRHRLRAELDTSGDPLGTHGAGVETIVGGDR